MCNQLYCDDRYLSIRERGLTGIIHWQTINCKLYNNIILYNCRSSVARALYTRLYSTCGSLTPTQHASVARKFIALRGHRVRGTAPQRTAVFLFFFFFFYNYTPYIVRRIPSVYMYIHAYYIMHCAHIRVLHITVFH